MQYVIRWINVNLAQTKHLSNVFSTDVLQLSSSLKARDVVDHMKNRAVFNIHDVYYHWVVEIEMNVIFQDEFKTFR